MAEVAVNSALINPILFPSLDAIGRFKRIAPVNMTKKKLNTIIFVGAISKILPFFTLNEIFNIVFIPTKLYYLGSSDKKVL